MAGQSALVLTREKVQIHVVEETDIISLLQNS